MAPGSITTPGWAIIIIPGHGHGDSTWVTIHGTAGTLAWVMALTGSIWVLDLVGVGGLVVGGDHPFIIPPAGVMAEGTGPIVSTAEMLSSIGIRMSILIITSIGTGRAL